MTSKHKDVEARRNTLMLTWSLFYIYTAFFFLMGNDENMTDCDDSPDLNLVVVFSYLINTN